MDIKRLSRLMTALTICFVAFWALFLSLVAVEIFLPNWESNNFLGIIGGLAALSMIPFCIGFYINLGLLAKMLNKSWITWVGLSFIFKPVGGIVAYSLMKSQIKQAISASPQP